MALRFPLLAAVVLATAGSALAIGISNNGTYRTNEGDRAPEEISKNIRIVPPPTGGDLQVSVHTDRTRYHIGDPIRITFGVNHDSYVFIFNTDGTGVTHQVFPNYYDRSNFLRSGKTYYVPDKSYEMEVTGPQGNNTISIVAVQQDFPFLADWRRYTVEDPYPASREGATALVRRIESFRTEPSALEMQALRPAPRKQLWANDSIDFYVMGIYQYPQKEYKVARYGSLDVDTYPSNARIYIDSDYFGRSPQTIDRLTIGYHRLRLTKEGYVPYECNIYIKGNETKQLDLTLKETPLEPGYSRSDKPIDGGGTWGFLTPDRE
ncbi:MAG: DUF4384 domain-containing protein [Candidatus Sumerlaeaceae bacterium]|nr:DUF4384 domain-containing protein [Candidatus Sumerlaeaceae bacterium]